MLAILLALVAIALGSILLRGHSPRNATLLAGKALGLILLVCAICVTNPHLLAFKVFAADASVNESDAVNSLKTLWTLLAAFLVFGMQIGFNMLETGLFRPRKSSDALFECTINTCLTGLLFYSSGFAFMFSRGNGIIGAHWFMLQGTPAAYEGTGVAFLAFWLLQFAFADVCCAVTSRAVLGRTSFVGGLLYIIVVSGIIYPIVGHWVWGPDGFLVTRFHDFAGSTVVHAIGGLVTLAAAIMLGPQAGRTFKRDDGDAMRTPDLTIGICGALLLWFGWYGFNPGGGAFPATDLTDVGRVALNTTLAACCGAVAAAFSTYLWSKKWDITASVVGLLAGLVSIACSCYWVNGLGSIAIGAVAGILAAAGVELTEWLRIDDPIRAVPVHGLCGIWGTLSLGLFACGKYGSAPLRGLLYGGGPRILAAQSFGTVVITGSVLAIAFAALYPIRLLNTLGHRQLELDSSENPESVDNTVPDGKTY